MERSAVWVLASLALAWASAPGASLDREKQEEFLRTAEVIATRPASKGVTGVRRVTLRSKDGTVTHDASVQCIDEYKAQFKGDRGPTELDFRDSWKYNVAAYKLAKMLGLDMVPATVERSYDGMSGSYCWWVEGVLMDEGERQAKKAEPPDVQDFESQYAIIKVFDELIYNVDRNGGNILITKDWRLWMIDHTRAFRLYGTLRKPDGLKKCERSLLARMKALDEPSLVQELERYLRRKEIQMLLKRRDRLVALFEKGGDAVLYDYAGR